MKRRTGTPATSSSVNASSLPKSEKAFVVLTMKLYLTAPIGPTLVIPEHRCEAEVAFPSRGSYANSPDLSAGPYERSWGPTGKREPEPPHRLINDVDDQLLVQGPGFVRVHAMHEVTRDGGERLGRAARAEIRLALRAVDLDVPVTVTEGLSPADWPGSNSNEISLGYWRTIRAR